MRREQVIVRTSLIGILANVFLAGFKAAVGVISGSIAIVLDAVNNLSDALSSVITIIGTKLANRRPDKKHPFGHGRIEYLTAIIISVIVLYAGLTSLVESIRKILDPVTPDYTALGLVIIAVAVGVKLALGRYVSGVGRRVNSEALIDSGKDATLDSAISASTLAAAGVFLLTGLSLEAWLGALIALVIIKSGVEMLRKSLSEILGERVDTQTAQAIKATVTSFPEVHGAYDLVLHNYGPNTMIGSVHVEVDDTLTADRLDELERDITQRVIDEHQVILAGIGVYSRNTHDDGVTRMREDVRRLVTSHDFVLQIHGFHVDEAAKRIRFDVLIDYAAPDGEATYHHIVEDVRERYPDYEVEVTYDVDVSD